jgi:hypothetical protein
MNFKTSEWLIILSSLLCAYLIWQFVAEPRIAAIGQLEQKSINLGLDYNKLQQTHEKFKTDESALLADSTMLWAKTRYLLRPGFEEAALMKLILNCTRGCSDSFTISSFNIMKPYYVQPSIELSMEDETVDLKTVVIDMETGMPVGVKADDGNWKGVEVVPVSLTYVTSFKSLIEFFSNFRLKKLPLYSIRSLDVNFIDSKLVRGTIILGFPLNNEQ